jgi:hypothetical protein
MRLSALSMAKRPLRKIELSGAPQDGTLSGNGQYQ